MPNDRNDVEQRNRYKSFVFILALSYIFNNKNIHNYKSKKTREKICSILEISERTFHRLLKSSVDNGFMFTDRDNKNNMRIKGFSKMVTEQNSLLNDENHIKYYHKCKFVIENPTFDEVESFLDTALLRWSMYVEQSNNSLSRKNNIHKAFKNNTKNQNLILSFIETKGNKFSKKLNTLYSFNNKFFNSNNSSIDDIVYKKQKTENNKTESGHLFLDKQIYNKDINKILNSVVVSFYSYYSLYNINGIYINDFSSKQYGESLGYTKSGFNSKLDSLESKNLIKRTQKYVFINSCDYQTYTRYKKELGIYCEYYGDDLSDFYNRIVYKNGCILFQRENHIKVNSDKIKFSWEREYYFNFVSENMDVVIGERYKNLCSSLKVKGREKPYHCRINKNINVNKKVFCKDTGEVFNSCDFLMGKGKTNVLSELKGSGHVHNGNKYFFVDNNFIKKMELVNYEGN